MLKNQHKIPSMKKSTSNKVCELISHLYEKVKSNHNFAFLDFDKSNRLQMGQRYHHLLPNDFQKNKTLEIYCINRKHKSLFVKMQILKYCTVSRDHLLIFFDFKPLNIFFIVLFGDITKSFNFLVNG